MLPIVIFNNLKVLVEGIVFILVYNHYKFKHDHHNNTTNRILTKAYDYKSLGAAYFQPAITSCPRSNQTESNPETAYRTRVRGLD